MRLSEYAQRHGVTYRTAWNRYKAGKIPNSYQDEHGTVHVPHPDEERKTSAAVYARVSAHQQLEDLDRQADRLVRYAIARGYTVTHVVKEVASGVNDARPKLIKLLNDDGWGTLVVEHRDRLTRVGYGWFTVFLSQQHRDIDVANQAEEQEEGMTEDFLSIIYSFAARMYGRRGAKNRAERAAQALHTSPRSTNE